MEDTGLNFKPTKVKMRGRKGAEAAYIGSDLLYSGINIFGQLSKGYIERIKAGEPIAYQASAGSSSTSVTSAANADNSAAGTPFQSSILDADIIGFFKKLQKRDAITKLKALSEIESYVRGPACDDSETLSTVLTFYLYHFTRLLAHEYEKGVRDSAH